MLVLSCLLGAALPVVRGWAPATAPRVREAPRSSSAVAVPLVEKEEAERAPPPFHQEERQQRRRKTLRSRFVEAIAHGWIRDAQSRGRLKIGSLSTVAAIEASECDVEFWGRRCPDVIRVAASDVEWTNKKKPLLRLKEIDWEFVNLHARILTKGKVGSMVARASASASDLDSWQSWRHFVYSKIAPELGATGEAKTVIDGLKRRISVEFEDESSVSFTVEAIDGKLNFKSCDLDLKGPKWSYLPSFFETIGEQLLSSVFLDATSALYIEELHFDEENVVHATVVSGDRRSRLHEVHTLLSSATTQQERATAAYPYFGAPRRGRQQRRRPNDEDVRFGLLDDDDDDRDRRFNSYFEPFFSKGGGSSSSRWSGYTSSNSAVPWPVLSSFMPRWEPTYTVKAGQIPWVLDAKSAAPRIVVLAFGLMAVFIHLTAQTDDLIYGAAFLVRSLLKPLKYFLSFFVDASVVLTKLSQLLFRVPRSLVASLLNSPQFFATQASFLVSVLPKRRGAGHRREKTNIVARAANALRALFSLDTAKRTPITALHGGGARHDDDLFFQQHHG